MREHKLTCDKFDFITILDVTGRKAVNEHASFYIKYHSRRRGQGGSCRARRRSHAKRRQHNQR